MQDAGYKMQDAGIAIFMDKPVTVGSLAANVRQLLAWQSARLEAPNQPLAQGW